jgi:hypothetical protein
VKLVDCLMLEKVVFANGERVKQSQKVCIRGNVLCGLEGGFE